MNYPNLAEKEVYSMPLNVVFKNDAKEYQGKTFVYAPLANQCLILDVEKLQQLEDWANGRDVSDEMVSLGESLTKIDKGRIRNRVASIDDYSTLVYLLNYKCNFACRYCYSAKGRSNGELDQEKADAILLHFAKLRQGRSLTLSFGGGGEPLLSWPLMRHLLEQAVSYGKEYHFECQFNMTTNGSLLTRDIIRTLKDYGMFVQISFEILPDIQNKQRGMYDTVASNIDMMIEEGLTPSISAIITPLSVKRQTEMVQHLLTRFPKLPHASFDYVKDYVEDLSMCENVERLTRFLDEFYDNFFQAKVFAEQHGFSLNTPVEKKVNSCQYHSCEGSFAVTAFGSITMCPRISSPQEKCYDLLTVANIEKDGLVVDKEKYDNWLSYTWERRPVCRNCMAKWNCGGGCPLTEELFKEEMNAVHCAFLRRFIARRLIAERHLL